LALQVIEDLLDRDRLFDAGDCLHRATAVMADLDVNIEDALQTLRPRHGCAPFVRGT